MIMYHKTTYSSGHTIHATHINRPLHTFEIQWYEPSMRFDCHERGYGLEYEAGIRWAKVLAETEDGAIRIAEYHYPNGKDFKPRESSQSVNEQSSDDCQGRRITSFCTKTSAGDRRRVENAFQFNFAQ